jgi:hypothetical protein
MRTRPVVIVDILIERPKQVSLVQDERCDDIGTFPIFLYVNDGSNPANYCQTILTVEDKTPPVPICFEITISLDGSGHASIDDYVSELVGVLSENCGPVAFSWTPRIFDCSDVGGTFDVEFNVVDGSANTSSCTALVHVEGSASDADCDGVSDPCDVCPSGDDTIDANGDGIPDCSQELAIAAYDPAWRCHTDRILACKVKSSGSQTKCIKANKIAEYLANGDHIGPCLECPPGFVVQGGGPILTIPTAGETLEVYPNPVATGNDLSIRYVNADQLPGILSVYDITGRRIYHLEIKAGEERMRIQLSLLNVQPGVHVIEIVNANETVSALFVVKE